MNLQNLNVAELNAREIENTDGGIWPYIALAIAILNTDWDAAANSYKRGGESMWK